MKLTKKRLKEIIKEEIQKLNEGPKFDEVKANMEKTMGLLVRKMGLKSVGRYLVGKGGMSFFVDDDKEAKKLQKYLQAKIKDVRLINLDKERSIDVIITRLRKKIEIDPKNPKYLQTIRGAGNVLWIE